MTSKASLLVVGLRWCLAAAASALGLLCALSSGIACHAVVESMSPQESGSVIWDEAPLYRLTLAVLPSLRGGLAGILAVLFAALSYPKERKGVACGSLLGGGGRTEST